MGRQNQLYTWLGLGHPIFEGPPDSVQELVIAQGWLAEELLVFWGKAGRGLCRPVQDPGPLSAVCQEPHEF